MGASVYYDCKRKNIDISRAFASATNQGVVVELPNSLAWKMNCIKSSFTGVIEQVANSYYSILRAIWRILFFLWTLVKKIGFIPIALSSSILLCIQNLDFLWIVPARMCLNSLMGTTWVGYAVSFIIFMASLWQALHARSRARALKTAKGGGAFLKKISPRKSASPPQKIHYM